LEQCEGGVARAWPGMEMVTAIGGRDGGGVVVGDIQSDTGSKH